MMSKIYYNKFKIYHLNLKNIEKQTILIHKNDTIGINSKLTGSLFIKSKNEIQMMEIFQLKHYYSSIINNILRLYMLNQQQQDDESTAQNPASKNPQHPASNSSYILYHIAIKNKKKYNIEQIYNSQQELLIELAISEYNFIEKFFFFFRERKRKRNKKKRVKKKSIKKKKKKFKKKKFEIFNQIFF